MTPSKEICFVSGLLPISESIRIAFSQDENPCYDFCDVLLSTEKSLQMRRLVDYFLSDDISKKLTTIRAQKTLTKANSGLDYSKVFSSSDLLSISRYLSKIDFAIDSKEEIERVRIIDIASDINAKSETLRVLLNEYSLSIKNYLLFLQRLEIPTITENIKKGIEQADKLLSILPSCTNVEMLLDTFESAAFVGQITPFLHSETLLAYVIAHRPELPFVAILCNYYDSESQFVLSTKRDMCPVCESVFLKLANIRSSGNPEKKFVVISTEEHEKSWERDCESCQFLIKIPFDTSVLKDFQAITETSVIKQIKQSSIPIYRKMSSSRGLSLFFGRRTTLSDLEGVVRGYFYPADYLEGFETKADATKLEVEDAHFLDSYFASLRMLIMDYQSIMVDSIIIDGGDVQAKISTLTNQMETRSRAAIIPVIKEQLTLRHKYMLTFNPFIESLYGHKETK